MGRWISALTFALTVVFSTLATAQTRPAESDEGMKRVEAIGTLESGSDEPFSVLIRAFVDGKSTVTYDLRWQPGQGTSLVQYDRNELPRIIGFNLDYAFFSAGGRGTALAEALCRVGLDPKESAFVFTFSQAKPQTHKNAAFTFPLSEYIRECMLVEGAAYRYDAEKSQLDIEGIRTDTTVVWSSPEAKVPAEMRMYEKGRTRLKARLIFAAPGNGGEVLPPFEIDFDKLKATAGAADNRPMFRNADEKAAVGNLMRYWGESMMLDALVDPQAVAALTRAAGSPEKLQQANETLRDKKQKWLEAMAEQNVSVGEDPFEKTKSDQPDDETPPAE